MELEHAFQQSGTFMTLQLLFMSSLLVPGIVGRTDIYRAFVRSLASSVVTFGPMALLLYVLYQVSGLS
jgi:hypothetical protein